MSHRLSRRSSDLGSLPIFKGQYNIPGYPGMYVMYSSFCSFSFSFSFSREFFHFVHYLDPPPPAPRNFVYLRLSPGTTTMTVEQNFGWVVPVQRSTPLPIRHWILFRQFLRVMVAQHAEPGLSTKLAPRHGEAKELVTVAPVRQRRQDPQHRV